MPRGRELAQQLRRKGISCAAGAWAEKSFSTDLFLDQSSGLSPACSQAQNQLVDLERGAGKQHLNATSYGPAGTETSR